MTTNDRFNQLPDSVLHHIMSFMKARAAVRTCVLSKRWRRLWASLRHLQFDLIESDQNTLDWPEGYYEFISRMLQERENIDVHTFCMGDEFHKLHDDDERARKWIDYAVNHNARVIDVVIEQWSDLPQSIYTCKSLEKLHVYIENPAPIILPVSQQQLQHHRITFKCPHTRVLWVWIINQKSTLSLSFLLRCCGTLLDLMKEELQTCPTFFNLAELCIYGCASCHSNMIARMLEKSPYLQKLTIRHGQSYNHKLLNCEFTRIKGAVFKSKYLDTVAIEMQSLCSTSTVKPFIEDLVETMEGGNNSFKINLIIQKYSKAPIDDFETLCSTLAQENPQINLSYKLLK
ncbi:hypothetical protein LUZ61_016408 [Rhynchospora tenuis]|uniref:F-box domain-containing protein n=1 Tax=Rhynchospora tenuis TaxID=198213 RepID=A0AAD6EK28_9POAL|nr:hypothetical protein LUZ61_016408 [Rhynchospora tenuis]